MTDASYRAVQHMKVFIKINLMSL